MGKGRKKPTTEVSLLYKFPFLRNGKYSIKVGCVYSVSKLLRENVSIENGGLRGGSVTSLQ